MILGIVGIQTSIKGSEDTVQSTIVVNDKAIGEEVLPVRGGRILVPIETLAHAMGATEVAWYPGKATLEVEIPFFSNRGLYLSYLAGLDQEGRSVYPLPKRLQKLPLPPYPLKSEDGPIVYQSPFTLIMADKGYTMPWAVYDYDWIEDRLYVGSQWLNVMFLADVTYHADQLIIQYPTGEVLEERIQELQNLVRPKTDEEAIALWINGQQVRSGALQYAALSPQLQEEVRNQAKGWVTGGSSPKIGEKVKIEKQQILNNRIRYTIHLEEIAQGKVYSSLKQELVLEPYQLDGETYWHIIEVKGDLGYSII